MKNGLKVTCRKPIASIVLKELQEVVEIERATTMGERIRMSGDYKRFKYRTYRLVDKKGYLALEYVEHRETGELFLYINVNHCMEFLIPKEQDFEKVHEKLNEAFDWV